VKEGQPIRYVYHMAEEANWASIRSLGLLPCNRLLDVAGVTGEERQRLEQEHRSEHTILPNGMHIRDQKPMPPSALRTCLIGLTPAEWYALINARVFFWIDPARLNRQRAACGQRPQVVLTLDARTLVEAYREFAYVTPINTGNARRRPARRGAGTFVSHASWLKSRWESESAALGTRERSRNHAPVELTIVGPVPDAMKHIVGVQESAIGQPFDPGV
jgi:hypothetical protein